MVPLAVVLLLIPTFSHQAHNPLPQFVRPSGDSHHKHATARYLVNGQVSNFRPVFVVPQRYKSDSFVPEIQPSIFSRDPQYARDYGYSTPSAYYTPPPPPNKYPLSSCYTNDSGFMCCNSKLESVMKETFNDLAKSPKWNPCNVQQLANRLQENAERYFNTSFEAIAGLGDYASKTRFHGDMICKVEMQGRFMMTFATPKAPCEERVPRPPEQEQRKPYYDTGSRRTR